MRRRLIISNVVLVAVVLLLLEIPLALVYSRHEHDGLNSTLQRDAASLAALSEDVLEHPGDHDVAALGARYAADPGGVVVIEDAQGNRVAPTGPMLHDAAFATALRSAHGGVAATGEIDGIVYVTAPIGPGSAGRGAVLVGQPDDVIDARVHSFMLLLVAIGLAVLAVAVLVARQLAVWAVGPLEELDVRAAAFGHGDLHQRADTTRGPPEIVALAATFNEMAARLDELVSSQRRFVADASHQLRTPLTALRLRLENLDPGDPAAVATTRDAALLEASRLTRLVDGLLALARPQAQTPPREGVDVTAVMTQRFEAWSPLAAEHGIGLRIEPLVASSVVLQLGPGRLEQVLDNLIDNALDATPAGRAVVLRTDVGGGGVEIHVTDQGPGMEESERERAFDPFWQSPRRQSNGSAGLGLAIVSQLVRSDGGTISLDRSEDGGVDAVVRYPSGEDGGGRP